MPKEIPLTKGHVAIVDDEWYDVISAWKWCAAVNASGIVYALRRGWPSEKSILMHRVIAQANRGEDVDHWNHNGLDNRRKNLRRLSRSIHHGNRRKRRGCKSQFKGVTLSRYGTWYAYIGGGRYFPRRHLGTFCTEEGAARAYNEAAIRAFGPVAHLNSV